MKRRKHIPRIGYLLAMLMMFGTIYSIGFKVQQSDFQQLLFYYALSFAVYILIFQFTVKNLSVYYFIGLGILLRIILIFSFPSLSDDIYRFIWDGNLAVHGINPFNHSPSYFIENQSNIPGITQELYDNLNSPNYFTVYPPVCQAIFAVSCWIFPESWVGSAMVMKIFMFAFECGTIILLVKLIEHFKLPIKNVLLYALNPLAIIEIMGNLHFEGAMIFFLLLAIWILIKNRLVLSALAVAFSIASKLLPLIFLPFLIKRLGWKKSLQYFGIMGIVLLLLFSPLINGIFIQNFGESLDLYFQKFEFNASIYYLLRWLFKIITGYNQIAIIGPVLGIIILFGIIFFAIKEQNPDFKPLFKAMLFGICLYLFLATTVHPWYVLLPLVLSIFTPLRFPVIWSGLIILTYVNYSYPEYFENLWMVALEYLIIFVAMFWEFKKHQFKIVFTL